MSSAQPKVKRDASRKNAASRAKQTPNSPLRTELPATSAKPATAESSAKTFVSTSADPLCVMDTNDGMVTVNHWNGILPNTQVYASLNDTPLDNTAAYAAKLLEGHKVEIVTRK